MDASWQPDPTGRHQYRWWDGAGWTDSIADNGQTGLDPISGSAAPATVIGGSPQPGAYAPSAPSPSYSPSTPFPGTSGTSGGSPLPNYDHAPVASKGGKAKWIVLALVVVAALGVVGFLVLGGDDGGGSSGGRSTYNLTDDVRLATKQIKLKKGEAVRIRVEAPRGMDTQSAIITSKAGAEEYASGIADLVSDEQDFTPDSYLTDVFTDAPDLFSDIEGDLRRGVGSALDEDGGTGDPDTGYIYAFSDIDVTLVVGAHDEDDNGTVVVIVEKYKGDAVSDFSDADQTFSDDPFFTDTGFFSDTDPYTGS